MAICMAQMLKAPDHSQTRKPSHVEGAWRELSASLDVVDLTLSRPMRKLKAGRMRAAFQSLRRQRGTLHARLSVLEYVDEAAATPPSLVPAESRAGNATWVARPA